jgi:uncharacterized metal-binding protein
VLDKFTNTWDPREQSYRKGTNLCEFMRTLVFGTILSIVSLLWWTLLVGAVITPFVLFGTATLPWIGMGIGVIVGVMLVLTLVFGGIPAMVTMVKEHVHDWVDNPSQPGFLRMVAIWLRAAKQKMCPIIKFTKETGDE